MKLINIISIFFIISTSHAIDADNENIPQLRSGLWETTAEQGEGQPPMITKMCYNSDTLRQVFAVQGKKMGKDCKSNGFEKQKDGYITTATCRSEQILVESKTIIKGDLSKEYTFETTVEITPKLKNYNPAPQLGKSHYVGLCPTGMNPGDIDLGNGEKINIVAAMESQK